MALKDNFVNSAGVNAGFIVIGDITAYIPNPNNSGNPVNSATIEVRRFINQEAAETNKMWISSVAYQTPISLSYLGTMSLRKIGYLALKMLPDFADAEDILIVPVVENPE